MNDLTDPVVVGDDVLVAEAQVAAHGQRRFIPRSDGRPDPGAPGNESGVGDRLCCFGGVATTVIAAQQFDDDLWLVDGAAADDQSALAHGLLIGSAADGSAVRSPPARP